jgi:cobalt-zinc-cadmium efflux system outer membrane protein
VIWALLAIPVLPAQAQVVGADTVRLSWPEARALVLRQNPELVAAQLDTAVARGELRQAGLLVRFNPEAELLGAGGGNGSEVGVSQELEIFNQQGARRAVGRAGLARARAGVANASRLALGEVERAFYRLVAATRRSALANEVLGLNRRLADVANKQLGEGEISRLEYNLATVELGRSRARALGAERERVGGNLELGRLLGMPASTVLVPVADSLAVPAWTDSTAAVSLTDHAPGAVAAASGALAPDSAPAQDSLITLALAQRPDLAERAAAIRQADAQATVAGREAWPNLVLRGSSEREAGESRAFRPGVGLTLPLFNRNRGEVEARRAEAQQAALERAALTIQVRAEVAGAVAAYHAAAAEVRVLEATVLGPARQNRQLLETAYREGKIGLPELLLIRNQAIEAELDYWTAWLAAREASATLAEATGQNLASPAAGAPE